MFLGLFGWVSDFWDRTMVGLQSAIVRIASGMFKIADDVYGVFATLATGTNVFDESIYGSITSNIYAAFGVIVLFVVAYNFLLFIVDPEKGSGENSAYNMLKKVVTTLALIIVLPGVFTFANGFVGSIVENGVIEKAIFGSITSTALCVDEPAHFSGNYYIEVKCEHRSDGWYRVVTTWDRVPDDPTLYYTGTERKTETKLDSVDPNSDDSPMGPILVDIFSSFFTTVEGDRAFANTKLLTSETPGYADKVPEWVKCPPSGSNDDGTCTLEQIIKYCKDHHSYEYMIMLASNIYFAEELNTSSSSTDVMGMQFEFWVSLASSLYIIYVLIKFCFDLAVRIIKLGFYQIISPLCIATRILPGGKSDIFKKWKSLTIKTYCVVLIRIFAMSLGVFIIRLLVIMNTRFNYPAYCRGFCRILVYLLLMLGTITFIKEIPQAIEDLIGEDTGLGGTIKDKLKNSVAPAAGLAAGIGAFAGSTVAGIGRGVKRHKIPSKESKEAKAAYKQAKKDRKDGRINDEKLAEAKKSFKQARRRTRFARAGATADALGSGFAAGARSVLRSTGLNEVGGVFSDKFRDLTGNISSSAGQTEDNIQSREARRKAAEDYRNKKKLYNTIRKDRAQKGDASEYSLAQEEAAKAAMLASARATTMGGFMTYMFGTSDRELKIDQDSLKAVTDSLDTATSTCQDLINKTGLKLKLSGVDGDGNTIVDADGKPISLIRKSLETVLGTTTGETHAALVKMLEGKSYTEAMSILTTLQSGRREDVIKLMADSGVAESIFNQRFIDTVVSNVDVSRNILENEFENTDEGLASLKEVAKANGISTTIKKVVDGIPVERDLTREELLTSIISDPNNSDKKTGVFASVFASKSSDDIVGLVAAGAKTDLDNVTVQMCQDLVNEYASSESKEKYLSDFAVEAYNGISSSAASISLKFKKDATGAVQDILHQASENISGLIQDQEKLHALSALLNFDDSGFHFDANGNLIDTNTKEFKDSFQSLTDELRKNEGAHKAASQVSVLFQIADRVHGNIKSMKNIKDANDELSIKIADAVEAATLADYNSKLNNAGNDKK